MRGLGLRLAFRAMKARYRDQKVELREIRRHVRPNDIVCDIGANKGSYLYWLARWCRGGLVVAFEPQPLLAEYLKSIVNSDWERYRNVEIDTRAVFSTTGRHALHIPFDRAPGASLVKAEAGPDAKTITVETVSLDDLFDSRKISLLKIDVEGAEMEVFKGAERILRESSPLLVFECEGRHLSDGTVDDVLHYLKQRGYDGHFVREGKLEPVSKFKAAAHQRIADGVYWKSPEYCNNFIMSKASQRPLGM